LVVVAMNKTGDCLPEFSDISKAVAIDDLFLERPKEPLDDPIGLWLLQEGKAGSDTPVTQLILEMVRKILSPMIHAETKTTTNVSSHRTEVLAQSHQDRFHGGEAVASYGSVADPGSAESIVHTALERFGRLDVVVNNAGILRDRSFANLGVEDVEAVLATHLAGAFWVSQPAFRIMKEEGYGRFVFTSSNSGLLGNFGQANYGAAKMGLVGLSNVLAIEGARYGITSNVVAPIARTRMTEDLLGPLAGMVDPELVTPMVIYLCSEENRYTHEIFSAGGGRFARFFIGSNQGWQAPSGTVPTVEDLAAHIDEVRDLSRFDLLLSASEELALLLATSSEVSDRAP